MPSFFTDSLTDCSVQVICRVRMWILVKTTNSVTVILKEWGCENSIKYTCCYCKFRIFLILTKFRIFLILKKFRIFLILTKLEYSKHPTG